MRSLAEVQQTELMMLQALEKTSATHGLPYFLAYGSALGAVRDGNQIPWDWDMDLWVPQPHYDALVEALRDELPDPFVLSDHTSVDGYGPLFARISRRGLDHSLVHLDLFPLVGVTSWRPLHGPLIKLNHVLSRVHVLKTLQVSERPHYSRRKRLVAHVVKALSRPVPQLWVTAVFRALNSFVRYDGARWVTSPCGPYGKAEFFPATWFASSRMCTLSGVKTRVPTGVEHMLSSLYGPAFMTPIPEEQQERALRFFDSFILPRIQAGLDIHP